MSKTSMDLNDPDIRQFIIRSLDRRGWMVIPTSREKLPFLVIGALKYFHQIPQTPENTKEVMVTFQIEMLGKGTYLTRFEIATGMSVLSTEGFLKLSGKALKGRPDNLWFFDSADSFVTLLEKYDKMADEMGYPKLFQKVPKRKRQD